MAIKVCVVIKGVIPFRYWRDLIRMQPTSTGMTLAMNYVMGHRKNWCLLPPETSSSSHGT
jgi:hypothetical protein